MNEPEQSGYIGDFVVKDRQEAAHLLAQKLKGLRLRDAIVLAIPRGGVVLGYEIARVLGAELDIVTPKKLGDQYEPELAIGAVMPDGTVFLNDAVIAVRRVPRTYVDAETARGREEASRRLLAYRGGRPYPRISGRLVVLVDDGIATGATMIAAARWVKEHGASRIIIAVPFIPSGTIDMVRGECDDIVYLAVPEFFVAVGQFYKEFPELTDQEVIRLLNAHRSRDRTARRP